MLSLLLCSLVATQTRTLSAFDTLKYVNPNRDFVGFGDKTYALLPPSVVAQEAVDEMQWSGDGKEILFLRHSNHPKVDAAMQVQNEDILKQATLCLYNVASGKVSELMTVDGVTTTFEGEVWLPDSDIFLVETQRRTTDGSEFYTVFRFNSWDQDGQIILNNSPKEVDMIPSPTQTLALLSKPQDPSNVTAALLENDGTTLVPVTPETSGFFAFDGTGDPIYMSIAVDPETKKRHKSLHPINLKTGEVDLTKLSSNQQLSFGRPDVLPIEVTSSFASVKKEDSNAASIQSLWLSEKSDENTKHKVALIASNADSAEVSPTMSMVAYVSQGALFIREIVQVDPDSVKKLIVAEERLDAMSKAKQVAEGMLMYSNDYDDNLPSPVGWSSAILPYLKDASSLSGFNYVFGGGTTTSIENPASTVLGFIQLSDGRVIAYTDGHVKWVP